MSGRVWKILFLLLAAGAGIRYCNLYREEQKIDLSQIPDRTSAEVGKEELMAFLPCGRIMFSKTSVNWDRNRSHLKAAAPKTICRPKRRNGSCGAAGVPGVSFMLSSVCVRR